MKKKHLFLKKTLLPASIIACATLIFITPIGCKSSVDGILFLGGDFSSPKIEDIHVENSSTVRLEFNREVTVTQAALIANEEAVLPSVHYEDENKVAVLEIANSMQTGLPYTLEVEVEDSKGNSATLSARFAGYNDHPAVLALSEIRIINRHDTKKPNDDAAEFVELYVLKDGNLSGLELVNAADGEELKYVFPPVEVKTGEYIVVHYRNSILGSIDETGDNLALATCAECEKTARDLFVENESKGRFGTKSDIVILRNAERGTVLDAFPYFVVTKKDPTPPATWDAKYTPFVEEVEKSGVWTDKAGNTSCLAESAYVGIGLNSKAHSACRKNVQGLPKDGTATASAADWYEADKTALQTPGKPNLR